MIERESQDELALVFKALAHPMRRQILDLLRKGPHTTGELCEPFSESRYAVMKHLDLLVEAGLVVVRRQGRLRFNHLNAVPIQQLYNRWVSRYESHLASSLVNLKNALEQSGGTDDMNKPQALELSSFQIEQEITIRAPREKVFAALTTDINTWWQYRLTKAQTTMRLEPQLGGRMYEDWGNGQGVVWGTVQYIKAPEEIRLNGPLGMYGAVNSQYTYRLEERGEETVLYLSHHASGLLEPNWEEAHRHGWQELLGTFLKEFVEEGKIPHMQG